MPDEDVVYVDSDCDCPDIWFECHAGGGGHAVPREHWERYTAALETLQEEGHALSHYPYVPRWKRRGEAGPPPPGDADPLVKRTLEAWDAWLGQHGLRAPPY